MRDTPPTQDNCRDSTGAERVLEVMFMFADGYSDSFRVSASPNGSKYAMRREGDGLLFTADSERVEVTNVELRNLWERFQKWKKRGDSAVTLAEFFSDLNRWGKTGEAMIEEVLALLLFAGATQEEIERKRQEDFWEPLKRMLPKRFHFKATPERPAYKVDFKISEDALVFEKNGVTTVLEMRDVCPIWWR
ncbi:MAG: hypothetical protein WCL08_10625, partial [Verrucomicrobiota bacterium]